MAFNSTIFSKDLPLSEASVDDALVDPDCTEVALFADLALPPPTADDRLDGDLDSCPCTGGCDEVELTTLRHLEHRDTMMVSVPDTASPLEEHALDCSAVVAVMELL